RPAAVAAAPGRPQAARGPEGGPVAALQEARRAAAASPASLDALLDLAGEAEFLGEFDEAQAAVGRAAALAPKDDRVLYRTATLAIRLGDYDRALPLLDGLIATKTRWLGLVRQYLPGWAPRGLVRSDIGQERIVHLKIDVLMEKGEWRAAREVAREFGIVRADQRYCGGARERILRGQWVAVFPALRLAALEEPVQTACLLWFGQWAADEGYVRLGRAAVMEAVRRAEAVGVRADGETYLRVRLSKGREIAKRVEQISAIARHRYQRDGDATGAVHLLEEAMRLDPAFARPHTTLAGMAWDRGDREGWLAWIRRALQADPEAWRPLRDLGMGLEALGRHAEAEVPLRRASDVFSADLGGRLALARALYAQRKFADYRQLTQTTLQLGKTMGNTLPEVAGFLAAFEQSGPRASLPPAPDPSLPVGWNYD
ncbi:MAG TPA: tetratricopeptide repeat protein, partial [Candidatus Methylomirabilis sp.]